MAAAIPIVLNSFSNNVKTKNNAYAGRRDHALISAKTRARLDDLIKKYGMGGYGGTVIAKIDGKWVTENLSFGIRDSKETPWTSDVSYS